MKIKSVIAEGVELLMELGGSAPRPPEWHLQHAEINKERAARYEGTRAVWAKRLAAEHELMAHRNSLSGLISEGRKLIRKRWSWTEVGTGRVGQSEAVERHPISMTTIMKTSDRVDQWAEKAKDWKTPGAKPISRRLIAAQIQKRLRDRMKAASV